MNSKRNRAAPFLTGLIPAVVLCTAMSGCFGIPDVRPESTAIGADPGTPRAAAIAEMRAEASAGDSTPYPDVFQVEKAKRLAAREEPLGVQEVDAIQAELALIAQQRAATTDAREIAALEARARELRRLVLRSGTEPVRQ